MEWMRIRIAGNKNMEAIVWKDCTDPCRSQKITVKIMPSVHKTGSHCTVLNRNVA